MHEHLFCKQREAGTSNVANKTKAGECGCTEDLASMSAIPGLYRLKPKVYFV